MVSIHQYYHYVDILVTQLCLAFALNHGKELFLKRRNKNAIFTLLIFFFNMITNIAFSELAMQRSIQEEISTLKHLLVFSSNRERTI